MDNILKKGQKAPAFEGLNQNEILIKSTEFLGKKLILFFYPKDNTPGCTAEACDLRDNHTYWQRQGFEVIGISGDSVKSHKRFAEKFDLPYDLIADVDKTILKDYGVWQLKKMYGREYFGIVRTTFVIDEEGIIIDVFRKVKTKEHTSQIKEKMASNE